MAGPTSVGDDRPVVLIIDDEVMVVHALELYLRGRYEVRPATSAIDGLRHLDRDVDAVILDLRMAEHDGLWAFGEIRKRLSAVPIILHSGYLEFAEELINTYKPFGYLAKGQSLDKLNAMLKAAVEEYRAHKRLHARMVFADRMASLGRLTAGAARELGDPIAGILANLDHIQTHLRQSVDQDPAGVENATQQALDEARLGAERVSEIITDLKLVAQGDPQGRSDAISVESALENAIKLARHEVKERGRILRNYADVPPVLGNESRLVQVFLNLLLNAANAIPAGHIDDNAITVKTHVGADGEVFVDISDSGSGIPEGDREHIFDAFYTSAGDDRVGLGLAIGRSVIRGMGGELTLEESGVNTGSRFRVAMPAAQEQPATVEPTSLPATPAPSNERRKVLVIDDDPFILNAMRRVLRRHDLTLAESGPDALAILAHENFNVILCDVMMPGVSGIDVYLSLKEQGSGCLDRIIFMTGGAFAREEREFLDGLDNVVLEKPIDPTALLQTIERPLP